MPFSGSSFDGVAMASFDAPRSDDPVRLAVFADPHLCVDETAHDKLHKPNTMFERALADADERGVDHAFAVGDLTREGVEREFDVVDDALDSLETPFTAIPGNHDVPNGFDDHPGLPVEAFAERYAPDGLPFVREVGDTPVVGLDSAGAPAVSDSHDGVVPESQVAWADDALADLDDPIVLVHHNLPDAIEQFDDYRQAVDPSLGTPPVLRDPDPLVEVLAAHDVPLVLSGHLHIPGVAVTEGVPEVLVPSTCTFPHAYLVVEVGPAGTSVEYVPVATPDESRTAYQRRRALKPKAAALTGMAAARVSTFPLTESSQ